MAPNTVAQSPIRAKYASVWDMPATIAKVNGTLYVIFEDSIEEFTPEMAPWTVILGDCQVADDQAARDRIAGGPAARACRRDEGRS
jgi:hypothetical protein